jgi:mono/diheme cytochrome c family protein
MKRYAAALLLAMAAAAGARADNPVNAGGSEVYTRICRGCHMENGQGAVGAGHVPKLAGNPALVSWQYVALTVLNGKSGMPAFGEPSDHVTEFGAVHLSDARIAEVVNYVRSHFGNRSKNTVTASQVAALPHPGSVPAP